MNKTLRALLSKMENKTKLAQGYMDGENKDVAKAETLMTEVAELKKEYEVELNIYEAQKAFNAPSDDQMEEAAKANETEVDGFVIIGKMLSGRKLNETEKSALLSTTTTGANGEENLLPHDVQLAIQELRTTHLSAKELLTVTSVSTLTGQTTYDVADTPLLSPLDDGDAIVEADAPTFRNVSWAIDFYAKLLPISRILVGAEKAGLMAYLNRWFVKSAVNTENAQIFTELKKFTATPKALKGWSALKTSINKDLDPSMLLDGVIVTNQTGWALLDDEKDENGRPILRENPIDPTKKTFQGLPVHVFPNAQLADLTKDTKAPIFYGSIKAGLEFKDYESLQFAVSEHYLFNKNQNTLRVIEGFDIVQIDKDAVIYGAFEATPAPEPIVEP